MARYLIRDPPLELTRYYSSLASSKAVIPKREMEPSSVVRTRDFWLIWVSFLLVSAPWLALIGHLMSFAQARGLDRLQGALAISALSVFNALGRPPASWISDRLGRYDRPITMVTLFSLQALLFLLLTYGEPVLAFSSSRWL